MSRSTRLHPSHSELSTPGQCHRSGTIVDPCRLTTASAKRKRSQDFALERVQYLSSMASLCAVDHSHDCQRQAIGYKDPKLITDRQRENVVKYIHELAENFHLYVQTGTLACTYFDRFLASLGSSADARYTQMIASTCLLIAAKFSDRRLPPLSELEKVHRPPLDEAHKGCARAHDFAQLELRILDKLHWKLHVPLPQAFVTHLCTICTADPFSTTLDELISFFIDLSIYGTQFLAYTPAAIAAASILAAWKISDEDAMVSRHLDVLARAVQLEPIQLLDLVGALDWYYKRCFPEAEPEATFDIDCIAATEEEPQAQCRRYSPNSVMEDAAKGAAPAPSTAHTARGRKRMRDTHGDTLMSMR